jgi:hypothetical protein
MQQFRKGLKQVRYATTPLSGETFEMRRPPSLRCVVVIPFDVLVIKSNPMGKILFLFANRA